MRIRARNWWAHGLLACAVLACRQVEDEGAGPSSRVQEVQRSLLLESASWRALEPASPNPPTLRAVTPGREVPGDSTALPAALLAPPAAYELELGAVEPGAVLELAVGMDREAFAIEGYGEVAFALEADSQLVFWKKLPYGSEVGLRRRPWERARVPLDGVKKLVLRTKRLRGPKLRVPAAFGLLEVVHERELHARRASREHPNVLFVLVDTLRSDRLGAYGHAGGTTPRIDAFAAQGTLYEQAYAASSWTFPSTASILTSLPPPAHGLQDHSSSFLSHEHLTLAEAFLAEGWQTAAWVTNPLVSAERDFDQGFASFHESRWTKAPAIADAVEAWLEQHGAWRFFLYVHLSDPHEYLPSEPWRSRFAGEAPKGYGLQEFHQLHQAHQLGQPHDAERFARELAYVSRLYDASVAEMDEGFGRLLDALERRGLARETLVVLTSDHGEAFLEHGLLHHGTSLHEEVVRVPLLLRGPGVPAGRRVAEASENRLLAPTLLRLAGIEPRANLVGASLLDPDSLRAAAGAALFFSTHQGLWPTRGGAGWRHVGRLEGVRSRGLLYLCAPEPPEGEPAEALYDLARDPGATRDLLGELGEERARLRAALEAWESAGARVRPTVLGGGVALEELLEEMGYLGGEEEPPQPAAPPATDPPATDPPARD